MVSELSENGRPGSGIPVCCLSGRGLPGNGLPLHTRSYLVILGYEAAEEEVIWHDDNLAQLAALQYRVKKVFIF